MEDGEVWTVREVYFIAELNYMAVETKILSVIIFTQFLLIYSFSLKTTYSMSKLGYELIIITYAYAVAIAIS